MIRVIAPTFASAAPLYQRTPTARGPRPAYIEIDVIDRTVDVGVSRGEREAVPSFVVSGRLRRYTVPATLRRDVLTNFLHGARLLTLAGRIADGARLGDDGAVHLSDAAFDAQSELLGAISRLLTTPGAQVRLMEPDTLLRQLGTEPWSPLLTLADAALQWERRLAADWTVLDGDIAELLLDQAEHLLTRGDGRLLHERHMAALVEANRVSDEVYEAWTRACTV